MEVKRGLLKHFAFACSNFAFETLGEKSETYMKFHLGEYTGPDHDTN